MTKEKGAVNGKPGLAVEGKRGKPKHSLTPAAHQSKPQEPGQKLSKKQKKRVQKQAEAFTKGPELEGKPEEQLGAKRKAPSEDDGRDDQSKRSKIQPTDNPTIPINMAERPALPASLPEDTYINKRPLFHPPIPSPYSGPDKQKTIYLSANASFMGTVKRVQKLMVLAEKRFNQKVDASNGKETQKTRGARPNEKEETEEVVLKGAGRAIERVVTIAVFLQAKQEYAVRLKVGSVSVVDDIEVRGNSSGARIRKKIGKGPADSGEAPGAEESRTVDGTEANINGNDAEDESEEEASFEMSTTIPKTRPPAKPQENVPVPETRVREVSMLEVGITLKSILRYEQGRGKKTDGYPSFS